MNNLLEKTEVEKIVEALRKGRAYNMSNSNHLMPINDNEILDIIAWARKTRQYFVGLELILTDKALIDIKSGKIEIILLEVKQ